jgi:hypothetical protein
MRASPGHTGPLQVYTESGSWKASPAGPCRRHRRRQTNKA